MLGQSRFDLVLHPEPLRSVGECVLDERVVYGSYLQPQPAGVYQPVVAMALAESQNTHAGLVELLRILLPGKYHLDVGFYINGDVGGHFDELVPVPFAICAMR